MISKDGKKQIILLLLCSTALISLPFLVYKLNRYILSNLNDPFIKHVPLMILGSIVLSIIGGIIYHIIKEDKETQELYKDDKKDTSRLKATQQQPRETIDVDYEDVTLKRLKQ